MLIGNYIVLLLVTSYYYFENDESIKAFRFHYCENIAKNSTKLGVTDYSIWI